MLFRKNLDNRLLFIVGTSFLTLRIVLQNILDRAGKSTDVTDFATGLVLGVGIGCLILFVWRLGHERRGGSNGARTS